MKETKEVATRQTAPPPAIMQNQGAEVMRSDILVPYVVLAQGMSDSVKERKAQLGDIVRSTNFEKLGDPDSPVDVIFLHYPQTRWIIEKKPKGASRFEFVRAEPRNASNETESWSFWLDEDDNQVEETTKGAIEHRRVKQLLVYAILSKDIEASQAEMAKIEKGELPDVSKALTPVLMSFRSTSYKAGKELCTFHTKASSMGIPIYRYSLAVSDVMDKNDEGSFYTWKVDQNKAKAVPKEHLVIVEKWAAIVAQGTLKADDAAEGESYESGSTAPTGTRERAAGIV